jgi:hypothetical protein
VALMHSARYQQALRQYQARKVRRRDFNEGDLVLRLRQDNRGRHKLSPPWEGPYVVVKAFKPGTYNWRTRTVRSSPTLGTSNGYVTSTLEKDFQALFRCLHTQHPIWLYNCKSHHEIKVKRATQLSLLKPSPPRGLLRGAPPPPKWSHFFTKNRRKCAKYTSTQTLGEFTRDTSSQRAKKSELGIAHASSRIRPFPLAALPTSYSCERNLFGQNSPKKRGDRTTRLLR